MVMSPGPTRPGGWGTVDVIADPNYARNQLAITLDFKTDVRNGQIVDASGTWRGKLEVPIGFEQKLVGHVANGSILRKLAKLLMASFCCVPNVERLAF